MIISRVIESRYRSKAVGFLSSLKSLVILWMLAGSLCPAMGQPAVYDPLDLLGGRKKVTIPFKYVNNFILLDVRIYGILPVQLIFDTGAEHVILFKRQYTDLLQVEYDRRMRVMGSDLSREIFALITRNGLVEVEGLSARPHDMLVLEEDYFNLDEMLGTPVAGLLGGGFFKDLVIQIDYRKRKLTLIDPRGFEPPGDHLALPVTIRTHKPYVTAEAGLQDGSVLAVDLLVDTGAGVPVLLHNNTDSSLHLPATYIRGRLGMGLGGYVEGYIGRLRNFRVGSVDFPGILTSFQDLPGHWLVDRERFRNGIIGNELLARFSVFLDYHRGQLYLRPYKHKQRPFRMDRSGLMIFAYGMDFDKFVIQDLIDGSPAQEAGIRPGDVLYRIQGLNVTELTLDGISEILQKKPGKVIRLEVLRDNLLLKKRIVLRDLI